MQKGLLQGGRGSASKARTTKKIKDVDGFRAWFSGDETNEGGFVRAPWSEDPETEKLMGELGVTVRCIPFDQKLPTNAKCVITGAAGQGRGDLREGVLAGGAQVRVKRRPATGEASSSSSTCLRLHRLQVGLAVLELGAVAVLQHSLGLVGVSAFSIAAIRSGVSSPAFSSSIFASQSAPSEAFVLVDLDLAAVERLVDLGEQRVHEVVLVFTFRSGLPWAKIRPSSLAPVIPKSACEASPIPFTAQPSTATSIGSV